MKNRQYNDAIKVLSTDIQGKADKEVPRHLLLLGQCQYVTRQYDQAKSTLTKALAAAAKEDAKSEAEYYLASTLYRQRDFTGALERIDGFARLRPSDPKLGKLLVFKMLIVAAKGRGAQADLESIHALLYRDIKRYDASIAMEADEVLSGFYRQHGMGDKAHSLYTRIVGNLRNVISESEKEGRPVPASLKKAADNAALNLGAIALERKQPQEAQKWLENVRFDAEMIAKAKLYLAKLAFEKQDWTAAIGTLTRDGFIDTVPAGQLKSDMYLIIGMAEKSRKDGNAGKVEEWLKQVGQDSRGFAQAQSTLGDLYREKAFHKQAADAYTNALASPDYAANALFALGVLALDQGEKIGGNQAGLHYKKSAEHFAQLFARFPLSPQAKQAKEHTERLAKKGVDVAFAASADEQTKTWEKTAKEKPGTLEGAQALISLARQHAKVLHEEKTNKVLKAADWVDCAAAADRLLDPKAYPAAESGALSALRAEALFLRGAAEVASLSPAKPKSGDQAAQVLPKATAEKAVELLGQARAAIDSKNLEMVKAIDLALVEAMFKSTDKELKAKAEARFGELEANYGNDPRFQQLALGLAGWYQEQGRLAEAAKQYAGVADRAKDMQPEELMKLYSYAGSLYSQAGIEASRAKDNSSLVLYLYPVLTTPRDQLEEPLKTLIANAGVPESELRKVIRAWEDQLSVPVLVAGPFANPGGGPALGLAHGPEASAGRVDPRAVFTDNVGKPDGTNATALKGGDQVRWQKASLNTSLLDFQKVWPAMVGRSEMAAYVATWVQVPKEQEALLCLGSDDGIKAWLNGGVVHENPTARANAMDQDKVKVRLKAGWNQVLLKVTQGESGWALNLRVATLDGLPLPDAEYADSPDGGVMRKGKER